MSPTEHAQGIPSTLVPLAVDAAHRQALCDMLATSNIFGDLSRDKLGTLAKYVGAFTAAKDTPIFLEGSYAGFMCIIIKGRVKIYRDSGGGRSVLLAEADAGNSLGEMSIIDGLPHSATAVAVDAVTLVTMTRADFTKLVDDNPRLATKILWRFTRLMSQRLRNTSGMLVDSLDVLRGR
jgi:CRP/FNR family transcriptional regulator, cyclic AMP receptor protein